MKWPVLVVLAALWTAVLGAYSDEQMQQLVALKGKHGALQVQDDNFEKFLVGNRDYHLVLYLSLDLAQLNCILCREFHPCFSTVAASFQHAFPGGVPNGQNVYFLDAEYVNSKKLFSLLKLDQIPKLYHLPPSAPGAADDSFLTAHDEYEFFQGDHTSLIAAWVTQFSGLQFGIYTPPDYGRIALNALFTFAAVMLARRYSRYVLAVLTLPILWGTAALVLILMCLAGHMFNQIRNTPYLRELPQGIEYINSSPQLQYGIETQIVSSVYGLLGLTFVVLVTKVPAIGNAKVQLFATVVVGGTLYLLYSIFLSVFAHKYRGYPYALLSIL